MTSQLLNYVFRNQIEYENGMIKLIDLSQYFINEAHYWRIPTGSKLLSYGGTLEWSYQYFSRYNSPTAHDDVIITSPGSSGTIGYRFDKIGPAERENKRALQLRCENSFINIGFEI